MRPVRLPGVLPVLVILVFCAFDSVTAQSRTNASGTGGIHEIRGKIYLPNGRTLETPIEVELSGPFVSLKVYTDRNGAYSFRNLSPGNYAVVADVSDQFEPVRESVTIDTEVQGSVRMAPTPKLVTVPIYLQLKRHRGVQTRNEVINAKWATVPSEAIERYEKGLALVRANKSDDAMAEFRRSVDIHPGFAPAHAAMGKLFLISGKLDDALAELRSAVKYDPADFEGRLSLGIALLNKMQFEDAQKELTHAADLNKTAYTPRYYLGVVYIQTKEYDRALKEMEAARGLVGERSFPLLHRYLGGIYVKKNMNKEAVAELETYIAQDPKARDADRIRQTIADLKAKQAN